MSSVAGSRLLLLLPWKLRLSHKDDAWEFLSSNVLDDALMPSAENMRGIRKLGRPVSKRCYGMSKVLYTFCFLVSNLVATCCCCWLSEEKSLVDHPQRT